MSKANTRVVDLNENLDPTGAENLYLATETTDEKISLNGVQKFLEKNFLKKSENLADINAEEWRKNLGVYSQDEVDEKNKKKADKQHKHKVEEITDFDKKVMKKIQTGIIAGENITIEIEDEKVKITSSGWSSGAGRGGDMLKSIYDKDNDNVIDKAKSADIAKSADVAKNAESVDWNNIQNKPTTFTPSSHTHEISEITDLGTKLDEKLDKSEKGKANGIATLNASGAIDSRQIPPYLENPLVYAQRSNFPATGQPGKLYMDMQTGNLYIWQHNEYCEYFAVQTERQKNQIDQNIRTKIWLYS